MKDLKSLLPYLNKYKKKLIIGFIVVTISNLCSTYVPRVIGETIDLVSKNGFSFEKVGYNIILILILTFFSGLFMFFTRRTIIVASREIEYDLRKDLMDSVRDQSVEFFHRNPTGMLMAHATNDIPAAREFLGPAIMYSANTITTFSFALYFMLSLDPFITFISLIPLPIVAYLTYLIGKKIHFAFKDVQEKFADLTTQAQESISGIRVVRAFTREYFELARFTIISRDYLNKNLKLARTEAYFMPVLMILVGMSQIIVLGYGGFQVINGNATLGDITQFFIYLELLIWPVAAIGWITNLIQRGAASAKRLDDLIKQKPAIVDNAESTNFVPIYSPSISFNDVCFNYSVDSNPVLKNINIKINNGETLGIIGTVGSGKSTLINLIPRLFDVTSGEITLDNKNIKDIPMTELRSLIGIVPQDPFLFSDTIGNNIAFGKPDASIEEIIEVSKNVKLFDEILTFENGFDTMLGERGITLSGGQKQRLAIARALLKNPAILILDDALSAVDANTEKYVLDNLRKFMKNRTTIIISHRVSTIKEADHIIFLEDGNIIEQGKHDELMSLQGRYFAVNKLQQIAEELEEL